MNAKSRKLGLSTAISLLISFSASNAFAATPLSDVPLFVTTAVEPNIFLTLDDSGSMDWEAMIPDTGNFIYNNGVTRYNGRWQAYLHPGWNNYQYYDWLNDSQDVNIIPPAGYSNTSGNALIQSFWVMQNHNYNTLYYNPMTDYTPWEGVDVNGDPIYTDADPTNTLRDPDRPGWDTVDLTANYDYFDSIVTWTNQANITYHPSFYRWTDDNTDGIVQETETHTLVEIRPATPSYTHTEGSETKTRSYAEEMQNFANWFQYYRKREFATKAAIGGVINGASGSRMGLRLINAGHQENLKTMSETTGDNKRDLLETFYGINSNGGTPLRRALERTGQMFDDGNYDYNGDPVILREEDGGECQQNFTLLMTDGFWNGSDPSVGNADRSGSDGDTDPSNGRGFDGDETESNDGGNYEDGNSNTLADVAMYYYERDLGPNELNNRVPITPGVDEAPHQHMVTYTVSFGVTGTIDPNNFDPLASGFSWPNPNNDPRKVDDLLHAAYNGRGLYLSAQNPVELEASLKTALADIEERKATSSAVSVTSARLTTDSVVYVSEFNTNGWQGTIYAYPIVEDADGVLSLDLSNPMNAAEKLAEKADGTGHDSRVIYTSKNGTGVPLRWANLSNEMKDDLRTNPAGNPDSDTIAQARLDYLRGDSSNEGQGYQFRSRTLIDVGGSNLTNVLGDIVHSGPVYVAEPNLLWPDKAPFPTGGQSYSNYKDAQENRAGVIYVGANDGMVHGFKESDMSEVMAYIPNNLSSSGTDDGLHYLTESNYLHKYYNDLTPTVSDVYINTGTGSSWRTIAVTGQRAGGRGYSALDVTNPAAFTEANADKVVLWEFTSEDDADLGYTFSRPQIGLANNGKWVAVFGNGYNNDGSGKAALFIVDIEEGIDGTWSATDYEKIIVGNGTVGSPNGLSTPALADLDGNGTLDRAYAGDLDGKLWVFDLSSTSSGSWAVANSDPLFTTIGGRPITSKPAISFHPTVSTDGTNEPNVMVVFGSGQYMFDSDKNSTEDNYFYGVWDHGTFNIGTGDLVEQEFRSGFSERVLTQYSVDYENKDGWYISMADSGERVINNPVIRSGFVFFNTNVPSSDACASSGYGYRFVVDLETGGTPDEPVVDTNEDGVVDDNDTIGPSKDVQSAERFERQLTDDTLTEKHIINQRDLKAIKTAPERSTGRVSWQELLQ